MTRDARCYYAGLGCASHAVWLARESARPHPVMAQICDVCVAHFHHANALWNSSTTYWVIERLLY